MKLEYRHATVADAELLIEIYNASFYSDYMKYGECPGYGKTKEAMEKSIVNGLNFLCYATENPSAVFHAIKQKKEYMKSAVYVLFRSFKARESVRKQ